METVLYDINLAEAEIENNYALFNNNSEKKQALLNAIFKKHKINKQQFDTSLVWYNAHLEQYFKIIDRVNSRYSAAIESLQKEIDNENRIREERSRVNIFRGESSFFLRPASKLQNTLTFRVDSIDWRTGDNLEVSFDLLGLSKKTAAEFVYTVSCADTTITEKTKIEANGSFSKPVTTGINKVKRFSAFIHIPDSIVDANIFINKFKIIHRKSILLEEDPEK
jgi:hypothetical protein